MDWDPYVGQAGIMPVSGGGSRLGLVIVFAAVGATLTFRQVPVGHGCWVVRRGWWGLCLVGACSGDNYMTLSRVGRGLECVAEDVLCVVRGGFSGTPVFVGSGFIVRECLIVLGCGGIVGCVRSDLPLCSADSWAPGTGFYYREHGGCGVGGGG